MTAPKSGTPEYALWAEGARDEAFARDEGLTVEQRAVRDVLESIARYRTNLPAHELAISVAAIFCSPKSRTWRGLYLPVHRSGRDR